MTITPLESEPTGEASETQPDPNAPARRHRAVVIGLVIVGALAGLFVARSLFSAVTPHLYSGTILQQSTPAPDMDGLVFATGEPVDIGALSGDLVLVYFGYTNCPDVCPTTLSSAATAISELDSDRQERVQLLMVTVDPRRDDLGELQEYVEFFHPDFRGVSGAVDDISRAASLYGIFYELGEGSIEEGYVVDHTATLMAIGTDGTLRIVWPPNISTNDLHNDLEELL